MKCGLKGKLRANSYSSKIENKQRFWLRGMKKNLSKKPIKSFIFLWLSDLVFKSRSKLSVHLLSFKDILIIIDITTTLLIPRQHKYEHCSVFLLTRCLWKQYWSVKYLYFCKLHPFPISLHQFLILWWWVALLTIVYAKKWKDTKLIYWQLY